VSCVHCVVQRPDDPGDRGGFAALELVIVFPFVIVMLLLVVAFGRVSRGRELVDQAAQAAARAGSLSLSPGAASTAAQQAAAQTLDSGGLSCGAVTVTVDTSAFRAGGQVTAHVRCTADLSALTIAGVPDRVTLTAASTSPIGDYEQITGDGGTG
jgi:Flp pilus assembly protein TadG